MSAIPRRVPVWSSRALSVAVVVGAATQVPACQDPSRGVAPEAGMHSGTFAKAPTASAGVAVGAPLFGLDAAPDGSLLAALASGVVRIHAGATEVVAELPTVNGVAAAGRGDAFVVTGGSVDPGQIFPTSRKLFRVSNGKVRLVADLWAYEQAVNPDQIWNQGPVPIESNPFDVRSLLTASPRSWTSRSGWTGRFTSWSSTRPGGSVWRSTAL